MMNAAERKALALRESLYATKQVVPFVVVNFNPVRLELPPNIVNFKVPREAHYKSPDEADTKHFAFHYDGREYLPSFIVLKDLIMDKRYDGLWLEEREPRTKVEPQAMLPSAQALLYWDQYNKSSLVDMGGILIFEGMDSGPLFQKDPAAKLRVPVSIPSPAGGDRTLVTTEERLLRVELKNALEKQKAYYERQYMNATSLHLDPERKFGLPSENHRVWGQWGLDMKFRSDPPPWMERAIQDQSEHRKCPACGRFSANDSAFFCICGVPYDPYAAFMAGHDVGDVHLMRLEPKQFAEVRKEKARRAKLLKELSEA
jgi:hypothetical protein